METNKVTEMYETNAFRDTLELVSAYWSKDDILVYTCYDYDDGTKQTFHIKAYNPVTNETKFLGDADNLVYVESEDCFIYISSTHIHYRYKPHTDTVEEIEPNKYYVLSELQREADGGSDKVFSLFVDDVKANLESPTQNYLNTMYVPLSFVYNDLGCEVVFQDPTITMTKGDDTLVLTLDSNEYVLNDETSYSEYMPTTILNQPYVPLRLVSTLFGYDLVSYEASNRICLYSNQNPTLNTSFTDDNSSYTLSPNNKYGYKLQSPDNSTRGSVYLKNMETGKLKKIYYSSRHLTMYWTDENKLILSGYERANEVDGTEDRDHYLIYDPEADTMTPIVDAHYGRYIDSKDIFIYETTVYNSDATTDVNSQFYSINMKNNEETEISRNKYHRLYYYDNKEQLNYVLYVENQDKSEFVQWVIQVYNSILSFFGL